MTTVEIRIPEAMAPYVESYDERQNLRRNALILYQSIRNGALSHGRAAELLGIDERDLIRIYEDMGIPYYDMGRDELDAELATYEALKGKA